MTSHFSANIGERSKYTQQTRYRYGVSNRKSTFISSRPLSPNTISNRTVWGYSQPLVAMEALGMGFMMRTGPLQFISHAHSRPVPSSDHHGPQSHREQCLDSYLEHKYASLRNRLLYLDICLTSLKLGTECGKPCPQCRSLLRLAPPKFMQRHCLVFETISSLPTGSPSGSFNVLSSKSAQSSDEPLASSMSHPSESGFPGLIRRPISIM